MLKLMKYELIKQRTSKVIIGAILALLEVAFLAGMLLGKEEIMAIAAGMLTFLASVSYTHLDVYKRQVPIRRGRKRFERSCP